MKICVLQPDYTGSPVDYGNYDPRRNLSAWLPGDTVDHLFLRKATTYRQLLDASRCGYDIFINLCEGYPEWDIPGFDVIWSLERLNLPYTGPSPRVFLPSKITMKIVAQMAGVPTPGWLGVSSLDQLQYSPAGLRYPLFVKPADAGDSLGIDSGSLVPDLERLRARCAELLVEFPNVLVEEYAGGREFTVLVAACAGDPEQVLTLTPFEFVFDRERPFKTYRMKVAEHRPESNIPVGDPALAGQLRDLAARVFRGFEGESYARIDFRAGGSGELYFLEINCECSICYPEGSEGSADYILKFDPLGHTGFLRHVIAEGIARHRRRQRRFVVRTGAEGHLGCFAATGLAAGETVLAGERALYRLASSGSDPRVVPSAPLWPPGLVQLRDADPRNWAPFRAAAMANLCWRGLDLVARSAIAAGEELTIPAPQWR